MVEKISNNFFLIGQGVENIIINNSTFPFRRKIIQLSFQNSLGGIYFPKTSTISPKLFTGVKYLAENV